MNALCLNTEVATIRSTRGMTRKQFERLTGIPAHRIEKIETRATGVSLETLQKLADATDEGKALAAKIFKLNFDRQAELHALLTRARELAGGSP